MAFSVELPWSDGEHRMHQLLDPDVPEQENPTSTNLTPGAAYMSSTFPLTAIGALDEKGRPWTTVWGGAPGHSQPLGGNLLGTRTTVDAKYDPVVQALIDQNFGKGGEGGKGMMVSGLPIDLQQRRRVKLYGRAIAGAVKETSDGSGISEIQLVTKIEQSLGNCPKYLNKKEIREANPDPYLDTSTSPRSLPEDAIVLLAKADLFFLSSSNADVDMDTNHRGGPPGFIRVISRGSESSAATIVYPEYSGNRLYQSLGNLLINPRIGICVPDFETGDVLYATGSADILIGKDAANVLPRTNVAVKITIEDAKFVKRGLPLRGISGDPSPYNPPVRLLSDESTIAGTINEKPQFEAFLVQKTELSPTVFRYRFRADRPVSYKAGGWVALDLSSELDMGYSHMRDDDPTSLNDDFVRTFTVSTHPSSVAETEFEITTRLHGPVTRFLKRQRVVHQPWPIHVRGFGNTDFSIKMKGDRPVTFVAGGVGITPLLGQLPDLEVEKLRLIWTTQVEDIEFVQSVLKQNTKLAMHATVFLTGPKKSEDHAGMLQSMGLENAKIFNRRLEKSDLDAQDSTVWYICASSGLRKQLLSWLEGKEVRCESFDY